MKFRAALLAVLLAGCSSPSVPDSVPVNTPPAVVQTIVAEQPLPEAVEAASGALAESLAEAQGFLADLTPTVVPPAEPRDAVCRRAAASLIIRWEVSSPAYYRKRLEQPIWPGGASGITWGIGYDGGHQPYSVITEDWKSHVAVARLARTAGIKGKAAAAILSQYRDIPTTYEYASRVFEDRSLVEYERRTRRAFGDERFDALRPNACASLVSLVYNRGAAMAGDSRREMKNIRDDCMPGPDYVCIAAELRSMKRLWRGTINENGLSARRESEAQLVETL